MLLRPSNFLVLDEPTNHLDVAACQVLENALRDYEGTLLFISHDRTFINALATRVVDVRHGTLTEYLGDYDRYLEKLEGGAEVAAPIEPTSAESGPTSKSAQQLSKQERIAAREREKERTRNLQRARKRLLVVEEELTEREEKLEDLSNQLALPHVYRDGEAVRGIEAARTELRIVIEEGYAEWERVAAEIEASEAAGEGQKTD
jgi:ATP-binding cassette subfamily F protein 3